MATRPHANPSTEEPPEAPEKPLLAVALVVLVVVIIAVARAPRRRERFTTREAQQLYSKCKQAFDLHGTDSYTEYRKHVPGADPVQYIDMRDLYIRRRLSPQTIKERMNS